jgi:dTDP-4-amino-4,6-dideoxygalactose transaminase
MIKVSIGDIRIGRQERSAIREVLDSGRLSEWKKVREFENLWAAYVSNRYCVAVNSGTSALLMGLHALLYDNRFKKIKRGSKVITSPVTYVATSNAIVLSGLVPVFVDIDPQTFTLNTDQIEELVKKNPEAYSIILPVHLMGYPNDMDAINKIAQKYNLVVFEDAAQAHGSLYKGKKAGSLSLLADFSFYIAHNIQAGEMGALVTSDERLRNAFKKIKSNGRMCTCSVCLRNQGACPYKGGTVDPRFTHESIGFNFKTVEFQAAIAIAQIKKADSIMKTRQRNVRYLNRVLAEHSDRLQLPVYSEEISYLAYPIVIKDKKLKRHALAQKLEGNGIEVRPLFGCIPTQQPAYKYLRSEYKGILPNADSVGMNGFYIGCHQYLTLRELDYVAEIFSKTLKEF